MRKIQKTYTRITNEEREEISRGLAEGLTPTEIAERLDRTVSTVTREIRQNNAGGEYRAHTAGKKARERASDEGTVNGYCPE